MTADSKFFAALVLAIVALVANGFGRDVATYTGPGEARHAIDATIAREMVAMTGSFRVPARMLEIR